ncbi:MAG: hypothetical protein KAJ19_25260 [Gammaproteobacteria bacterium]|nr:hypothetical protein [Gammaproteobacteria bacterium]
MDELTRRLAEALRPFAEYPCTYRSNEPKDKGVEIWGPNVITNGQIREAISAVGCYDLKAHGANVCGGHVHADCRPWCIHCQEAEMPGDSPAAMRRFEESESRLRQQARADAKLILVGWFGLCWEKMGCEWKDENSAEVESIVDAILTAAGA